MDLMGSPYLLAHGLGVPVDDASDGGGHPEGGPLPGLGAHQGLGGAVEGPGHAGPFPGAHQRKAPRNHLRDRRGAVALAGRREDRSAKRKAPPRAPRPDRVRGTLRRHPVLERSGFRPAQRRPGDGGFPPPLSRAFREAGTGRRVRLRRDRRRDRRHLRRGHRRTPRLEGRPHPGPAGAGRQQQLGGPRLAAGSAQQGTLAARRRRGRRTGSRATAPTTDPTNTADLYEDDKKLAVVRGEPNIDLFLEHRGNGVEMEGRRIRAVLAQEIRTGRRLRIGGRWFADCTGDACIGALAGADFDMQEKNKMGPCNLWNVCECKDTNAINTGTDGVHRGRPLPALPVGARPLRQALPGPEQGQARPEQARRLVLGERLRPRPDRRRWNTSATGTSAPCTAPGTRSRTSTRCCPTTNSTGPPTSSANASRAACSAM